MTREEAIKEIKSWDFLDGKEIEAIHTLIPELESEDERIRRELIEFIQWSVDRHFMRDDFHQAKRPSEWIAYLEKQKEILTERAKNITANLLEDGITGIQRELIEFLANNIDASWVDVIKSSDAYAQRIGLMVEKQKEPHYTKRNALFDKCVENCDPEVMREVSDKIDEMLEKEQKHILKFKVGDKVHLEGDDVNILTITGIEEDRYLTDNSYGPILFEAEDIWQIVEQKSAEWSEEDEEMFDAFMHKLEVCDLLTNKEIMWAKLRLKSLRPQPKVELTLLDENIIEAAVAFVEQNNHFNYWGGIDKRTVIKVLRSLKPHWKPSKDQMEALLNTLHPDDPYYPELKSLHEQLQKL